MDIRSYKFLDKLVVEENRIMKILRVFELKKEKERKGKIVFDCGIAFCDREMGMVL